MLELFSSFNNADFALFEKFISSPLYNSNRRLEILFGAVRKHSLTGAPAELTFELLHKYAFRNEKFSASGMRKLSSQMTALIKQYFIFRNLEGYPQINSLILLRELNKRNLNATFSEELQRYRDSLDPAMRSDVFLRMYDTVILYDEYRSFYSAAGHAGASAALAAIHTNLDTIHLTGKLITFSLQILNNMMMGREWDTREAEAFIGGIQDAAGLMKDNPTLYLIFHLLDTLLHGGEERLSNIILFFRENFDKFSYGTADLAFNVIAGYLVIENSAFLEQESFSLSYSDLEAAGIMARLKLNSPFVHLFIINLLASLPSVELLEKYLSFLTLRANPDQKENLLKLAAVIINIKNKKYHSALKNIQMVRHSGPSLFLITKIISVTIHSRLRNDEMVRRETDSLRHYLSRRDNIPGSLKTNTLKLIDDIRNPAANSH